MSDRLYFMSELSMKVTLDPSGEASWMLDDLLVNAAISSAALRKVSFIGRAAADVSGQFPVDTLVKAGIDINGVDRYTDVPGQLSLASASSEAVYDIPSAEAFNPVWPRFEDTDVMVWGGYFSLDPNVHKMMLDILSYARARGVTMVYVPYFSALRVPRVTRVMPLIFDNLELADVVVADVDTVKAIFGNDDPAAVFANNINFYARHFFAIDTQAKTLGEFTPAGNTTRAADKAPAEVVAEIAMSLADKK